MELKVPADNKSLWLVVYRLPTQPFAAWNYSLFIDTVNHTYYATSVALDQQDTEWNLIHHVYNEGPWVVGTSQYYTQYQSLLYVLILGLSNWRGLYYVMSIDLNGKDDSYFSWEPFEFGKERSLCMVATETALYVITSGTIYWLKCHK